MTQRYHGKKFSGHKKLDWPRNLYYYLFRKFQYYYDFDEANAPILISLLDDRPNLLGTCSGQDRECFVKYLGINQPEMTLAAIAKENGHKTTDAVKKSIEKCGRRLYDQRKAVKLLYTPHFTALCNCTELGNCLWRSSCKVDLEELINNPQRILEIDDSELCETLKAWKATIPPTVFKSPFST